MTVVEHQWDLKAAYDRMEWSTLMIRGRDFGFPMAILRFSIRTYTYQRRFSLDGTTGDRWVFAKNGVVAGGASAPSEIKVYVLPSVLRIQGRFPK